MRQFTTPVETFRVKGQDLSGATVKVTFSNKARNIVLTIDNPTVTIDGTDSLVEVHLTQAQTGLFPQNEDISVEVNWKASGERYGTAIGVIPCEENLLKEVW